MARSLVVPVQGCRDDGKEGPCGRALALDCVVFWKLGSLVRYGTNNERVLDDGFICWSPRPRGEHTCVSLCFTPLFELILEVGTWRLLVGCAAERPEREEGAPRLATMRLPHHLVHLLNRSDFHVLELAGLGAHNKSDDERSQDGMPPLPAGSQRGPRITILNW